MIDVGPGADGPQTVRHSILAPIEAMILQLPRAAVEELGKKLHAQLLGSPSGAEVPTATRSPGREAADLSPAERSQAELGSLAAMLAAEARRRDEADRRPLRVPRSSYDEQRSAGAPAAAGLVKRYGSWLKVCRAAAALDGGDAGGSDAGGGRSVRAAASSAKPWATPSLGDRRNQDYTREEIIDAVIEVAGRLGVPPAEVTSNAYYEYVAEMRRRARKRGDNPPRWPTQRSVERRYKSWRAVLRSVRQR